MLVEVTRETSFAPDLPADTLATVIADKLAEDHGLWVKMLNTTTRAVRPPDATLKFHATNRQGDDLFMIVSSPLSPNQTAQAVANIELAHEILPATVSNVILKPISHGYVEGLSFAAWERHTPLDMGNRVMRRLRRMRVRGPVLDWTYRLCRDSLSSEGCRTKDVATFTENLQFMAAEKRFPAEMRAAAKLGLARLDWDAWRPFHCVEHGDFWAGNLLADGDAPFSGKFLVIDWAGMKQFGYPMYDFIRFVDSIKTPVRTRKAYARTYMDLLECEPVDLQSYLLSSLGAIGRDLDFFSPEVFRQMSERTFGVMQNILADAEVSAHQFSRKAEMMQPRASGL